MTTAVLLRHSLLFALVSSSTSCTSPEPSEPSAPVIAEPSAAEAPAGRDRAPAVAAPKAAPKAAPEAQPQDAPKTKPRDARPTGSGTPTFTRVLAGKHSSPRLHPLADGNLLLSVGPQIYVVEDGKPLKEDPALLRGLPSALCPIDGALEDWLWDLDITGRWPDAVFASVWIAAAPNAPQVARPTFRRRDGVFTPMKLGGKDHRFHYAESRPYVDGSLLSLKRYMPLPPKGMRMSDCTEDDPRMIARCDARFAAVERKAAASKPLVVTRGLPKGPDLEGLLGRKPPPLATFDSLPSGHVFAATAETSARMLVVTPKGATLEELPGAAGELRIHAVRALADDLVFAVGGSGDIFDEPVPHIYRYDGRSWIEQEAPPCPESTELWSFEPLPSGDRVALCVQPPEEDYGNPYDAQPLFWQRPGGSWVQLKKEATAIAVYRDQLWVTDRDGVYTTAPTGAPTGAPLTATSREKLGRTLIADGPPCLGLLQMG